jgi:APA family basic amino acid/polyamine antiporter
VAGDRVANPQVTVPRATLLGAALTGLIYLLASSAVAFLLPAGEVAQSNAPFALFFSKLVSPALGPAVALFAAIAALGALNGFILLQGELLLVLARKAMLPAWLAVENRHHTPQRAHIVSSLLASLVVLANYTRGLADLFTFMVLVTTSVSIIFYLAGTAASLKLARQRRIGRSPGFELVAVAGFIYSLWTFYGAGLEASVWSVAMTVVGIPIYWLSAHARRGAPPAAAE